MAAQRRAPGTPGPEGPGVPGASDRAGYTTLHSFEPPNEWWWRCDGGHAGLALSASDHGPLVPVSVPVSDHNGPETSPCRLIVPVKVRLPWTVVGYVTLKV